MIKYIAKAGVTGQIKANNLGLTGQLDTSTSSLIGSLEMPFFMQ